MKKEWRKVKKEEKRKAEEEVEAWCMAETKRARREAEETWRAKEAVKNA